MTRAVRFRKLALTAHVACSVGWSGAIVAFLGLGIAGLATDDAGTASGVYVAMEVTGRYVLVPFAVGSLLTGVVQSLVTRWGLVRHYWVVAKLAITVFAAAVLLMYLETLDALAVASRAASPGAGLGTAESLSPVLHAGAALALLLVATVLAVYKPRGLTPYGLRKQRRRDV